MKLDKLVGERFKEKPADCIVDSHALMVRGGYMKFVAAGIYSQYTSSFYCKPEIAKRRVRRNCHKR